MRFFLLFMLLCSSLCYGKIYDCFLFFNELDLLEIRLEELNDKVDYFVLIESKVSHRNKKKPLYFRDNKKRFRKYLHKIRHLVLDDLIFKSNWGRENYQRNSLLRGLYDANWDDIVMISDVDEIPSRKMLHKLIQPLTLGKTEAVTSMQRMFRFNLNRTDPKADPWYGTTVCKYNYLKNHLPQDLRNSRQIFYLVDDSGWHFSSLGDVNNIIYKFTNFAHEEVDTPEFNNPTSIRKHIEEFPLVPVDKTFPKHVLKNIDLYKKKGYIVTE